MIINSKPRINYNQKGFTLVELMMVLVLLGLILAGIYQFFFFTNRAYTDADKKSIAIQEANLFISQIEREIRQATKPNEKTKAVRILNDGEQIDIYSFNNESNQYKRTSYRLDPNDKTQLQKGWVEVDASATIPGEDANPQYAEILDTGTGAWKDIVTNVDSPENLFMDSTDDTTITSERRLIKVNLKILDPETNRPLSLATSVMSRSGRSLTSILSSEGETDNYIYLATDIKIIDNSTGKVITIKNAIRDKQYIKVTAVINPEYASNKDVNWTSNKNWLSFAKPSTSSGEEQVITVEANDAFAASAREGEIIAKTADASDIEAIVTIKQKGWL